MDLLDIVNSPEESNEPHVFSVSEINQNIRQILEGEFSLIWIRGEISNFKPHSSGHWYFSIKDKKSQMNALMFRGFNAKLKFRPQDGQEVLIRGKITVYEPRGNYQLFCEVLEPIGAGALQLAFEELKRKLYKEGLFDAARKRPLPILPKHIALVTSPTGAAVRDMLNVLARRFKGVNITIVPAVVQGDRAPESIIEGLRRANLLPDVDVLIVGRGGGSTEDMWCFNDEGVARAIVASRVPVISAVGHEIDFTIADFVADLRAPTPSAAAELVIKNASDLVEKVFSKRNRLLLAIKNSFISFKKHVEHNERRLVDPQRKLQDFAIRNDELTQRLEQATLRYMKDRRLQISLGQQKLGSPLERIQRLKQDVNILMQKVTSLMQRVLEANFSKFSRSAAILDSLSPLKVVERGYSITKKNNKIIKDAKELSQGESIDITFSKGRVEALVKKVYLS